MCSRSTLTVAVWCLLAALAHANCLQTALKKGTGLVHGTAAAYFDPNRGSPRFVSGHSQDKNHPYAPAWLADKDNSAFSVQAALLHLAKAKAKAYMTLFWYKTGQDAKIMECGTYTDAIIFVNQLTRGKHKDLTDSSIGLGTKQILAGKYFCEHQKEGNLNDKEKAVGYIIKKDAVRKEREYIMCNANHGGADGLIKTGRTRCTVRAKKQAAPATKPALWIHCGKIWNQWYKWDLGAKPIWSGFRKTMEKPWFKKDSVTFAEILARKFKTKSMQLQPKQKPGDFTPPNEEGEADTTKPDAEEISLIKTAFEIIAAAEAKLDKK